jgi:chromosome segregation ATPase
MMTHQFQEISRLLWSEIEAKVKNMPLEERRNLGLWFRQYQEHALAKLDTLQQTSDSIHQRHNELFQRLRTVPTTDNAQLEEIDAEFESLLAERKTWQAEMAALEEEIGRKGQP